MSTADNEKSPSPNMRTDYSIHTDSPIKMIIARAVTDPEFKKLLLANPDEALKDYTLSEVQVLLIRSIKPSDLEKLTPENLQEYFSADAAVYTPDESKYAAVPEEEVEVD